MHEPSPELPKKSQYQSRMKRASSRYSYSRRPTVEQETFYGSGGSAKAQCLPVRTGADELVTLETHLRDLDMHETSVAWGSWPWIREDLTSLKLAMIFAFGSPGLSFLVGHLAMRPHREEGIIFHLRKFSDVLCHVYLTATKACPV